MEIDTAMAGTEDMLVMCCVCKKVRRGDRWVEAGPVDGSIPVSHTYCPDCADDVIVDMLEKQEGTTRIKCAAIRHVGHVFTGRRHCEIGLKMIEDGVCQKPYPGGDAQGFVTECGAFVRRELALAIAIKAGQVEKGKTVHPTHLFSEDL